MNNTICESNLLEAHQMGENSKGYFNCWGGTLFILNQIEELDWVCQPDMEDFLNNKTFEIKESDLIEGDIVSLWDSMGCLVHTAVLTNKNLFLYWHKLGAEESEYARLDLVLECYDHDNYKFNRIK